MSDADPFAEGALAYLEGLPFSACPYNPDSIEELEWRGAWLEASDEDADD